MIKILKYGQVPNSQVFARVEPAVNVEAVVSDIIANVRRSGDKAVLEYNLKFDKAELTSLRVSEEEIEEIFAKRMAGCTVRWNTRTTPSAAAFWTRSDTRRRSPTRFTSFASTWTRSTAWTWMPNRTAL